MSRLQLASGGSGVTLDVFFPDRIIERGEKLKALWLLSPKWGTSTDWPGNTQLEYFLKDKDLIAVSVGMGDCTCTDWKDGFRWERYFTEGMWDYVHALAPISYRPEDNFILGCGASGYGALKFALVNPMKFGKAYALDVDDTYPMNYLAGEEVPYGDRCYGSVDEMRDSTDNYIAVAEHLAKSNVQNPKIYLASSKTSDCFKRTLELGEIFKNLGYEVTWNESDDADWDFYNKELREIIRDIEG